VVLQSLLVKTSSDKVEANRFQKTQFFISPLVGLSISTSFVMYLVRMERLLFGTVIGGTSARVQSFDR
jgi:hypothetical protein